jgi:hypothetical protein
MRTQSVHPVHSRVASARAIEQAMAEACEPFRDAGWRRLAAAGGRPASASARPVLL